MPSDIHLPGGPKDPSIPARAARQADLARQKEHAAGERAPRPAAKREPLHPLRGLSQAVQGMTRSVRSRR
jgi:hypothetical protein